jgi:hypothetical protein
MAAPGEEDRDDQDGKELPDSARGEYVPAELAAEHVVVPQDGQQRAALLILLRDAQALVSAPDRIQVLASHARLVLSDAEQLTQQPADLLEVRDQAALLLADGT